MKKIFFCLSFFLVALVSVSFAQVKATTSTSKKFVKFKPPKLFTSVGTIKDSAMASPELAKSVLDKPIFVTDATKGLYTVQSYQFLYKKRTVSEDENGNAIPSSSISSQQFYNAKPLPEVWVKVMSEDLKKGEEIWFFDIIVKDKLGRIMHAPDLKILTR